MWQQATFLPRPGNEMWVHGDARRLGAMSVRNHRGGWETRWRDASGRNHSKRFKSEEAARAYDDAVREASPIARRPDTARSESGVYTYSTRQGIRWRFVVRRSDGSQTPNAASRAS
jgi:hypothetical protein